MNKRAAILALLCATLLAALALKYWNAEPSYRGTPLTVWLQNYRASPSVAEPARLLPLPDAPEAEPKGAEEPAAAVRQIDGKALPVLVKWLSFRPSPLRIRLSSLATKLPQWVQNSAPVKLLSAEKAYDRFTLALGGFVILRTNAAPAIPQLATIASDPTAPGSRYAIRALIEIGPPAVPALTNLLSSSQPIHVKEGIRMGLGKIGPSASPAIPALLNDLRNPDMYVAGQSAAMLGKIGQEPQIVVPALIAALDDDRRFVRQCAAAALGKFGPNALPAVPKLKSLLGTHNLVDDAARRTLRAIAPEELKGVPEWQPPGRESP